MTERAVNDRRAWKAQTFWYEYYISGPGRSCTVCLTDKQRELLLGLTEPLAWRTRWWSELGTIEQDTIDQFRDDLRRRIIMACCGDEQPIQFRYTSDGVLQRSDDGGVTYYDSPTYDPRNYSPQFPPIPGDDGDDKKCVAAAGAAQLVQEQVGDNLTDEMTRYSLSQVVTDWVKIYIETSNPFEALLTVVANQIFALVIATLRPALTEDVYHLFQCILYCNMSDDGIINQAAWSQIRTSIFSEIEGIAGIFLEHLVYLLGAGGMTNLVRAGGAADGDCSDCDCGGCDVEWTFYGLHDVVQVDQNHYTGLYNGGGEHVAFSSGTSAEGCYYAAPLGLYSYWPVGSAIVVDGTNPRLTAIWNADFGLDYTTDQMFSFEFSDMPLA